MSQKTQRWLPERAYGRLRVPARLPMHHLASQDYAMTTTYHFVPVSLLEGSIFLLDVESLTSALSISSCDMLSIVGG